MMPLMDAPISTVSRQYARDLVNDPLQTVHFTDHLQEVFRRQGLIGVDNGLFMPPIRPFSEIALQRAVHGDVEDILDEKLARRRVMLRTLTAYRPPQCLGWLRHDHSWDLTRLPDHVPVFMIFGRMDPGQKGFDLLANAIRRTRPGAAKFVVCPMLSDVADRFVDQWRDLARVRPGDIVVYTSRMDVDNAYAATMAGASFCVMPSLHEPFGAATEPYLRGTPVVAHATGGLIQQVVDLTDDPQHATGILFRDRLAAGPIDRGRQWRRILLEDEPAERIRCPLYVSLVNGLTSALEQAIDLHQHRRLDYGRMLAHLYDQARKFSWEKAAAEYTAIYDRASSADAERS
jgi:glycosyltransferase involved in cell wall biosynthesis